jgi:KaiC/GvpD/RAD55 family RecA-like ATPase
MGVSFKRARKAQSKLRMALAGPSGSGKTMTALVIAAGLANGGPVAVIDTERGSASKYADQFAFDVLELESFHPERYIEAIEAASQAGYAVLVIDSLSHAWNGTGGALELHDQAVKRQKTQNSYTAWADITPLQNRLVNAITGAPLHVIVTMRAKTEYIQDKNERGGTTIRKVGMAPIQRDGMEYEYDIFAQLDLDHTLIVEKSRCPALSGAIINKPDARLATTLADWLQGDERTDDEDDESDAAPEPPAAAQPRHQAAQQAQAQQQAARTSRQPAPAQAAQSDPRNVKGASNTGWRCIDGYDPHKDMELRARVKAIGVTNMADFEAILAHVKGNYHSYTRAAIDAEMKIREGRYEQAQAAVKKTQGQAGASSAADDYDLHGAFPVDQQRGA